MNNKANFSDSEWNELFQCFLDESIEHLEGIEPLLLQLESSSDTGSCETITNQVFRAAHSIKGSSGMFGFSNIHNLSHKIEWLLENLRSGKTLSSHELIDTLLQGFDRLRHLIENAQESNDIDISDITIRLDKHLNQEPDGKSIKTVNCTTSAVIDDENVQVQLDEAVGLGLNIYLAKLNLIKDIDNLGKSLSDFLKLFIWPWQRYTAENRF